jgi:hypothetical protein
VPREENVKVTLSLSRRSLDFFKREAKRRRVPYRRMIRALVDKLCGAAGRRQSQVARIERSEIRDGLRGGTAASRITLRSIRATVLRHILIWHIFHTHGPRAELRMG